MSAHQFGFAFDPSYRVAALAFGISPRTAVVVVDAGQRTLVARFGPWQVCTALDNITGTQLSGPFQRIKTIGPARLSISDRGLTFATNPRHGLCLSFADPVPGLEPTGRLRHPNLTVTVADPDGLAVALRR